MFKPLMKSNFPLGCIVTEHEVRLMQLLRTPDEGVGILSRHAPAPPGEAGSKDHTRELAEVIRQLIKAGGFRARHVISMVRGDNLWCRRLRVPPMPDADLPAAAHWMAAKELSIGAQSFTSQTLKLATVRDGSSKVEVLTIGADTAALEEHARMLVQAGLEPRAIDARPWALARTLTGLPAADPSEPLLVLDLGVKFTDMIVARDGELLFLHRVNGGALRISELLAHRLDISLVEAKHLLEHPPTPGSGPVGPAEKPAPAQRVLDCIADAMGMFGRELAREISLSLFHFREVLDGGVPERAMILGPAAAAAAVEAAVAQLTGVEFVQENVVLSEKWLAALNLPPDGASAWLPAVGLALYGIEPAKAAEAA